MVDVFNGSGGFTIRTPVEFLANWIDRCDGEFILRYMANYQRNTIDDLVAIAGALSDVGRVRVLTLLKEGELCLCQIIEILGLAPSTVSKHMSILRQTGLIEQRKEGRWHFYRLAGTKLGGRSRANGRAQSTAPSPLVKQAIRWVMSNLSDEPTIKADAKRLRRIQKMNPEELTRCYRPTATK